MQDHAPTDSQTDQAFASRDAVLADAGGLLTCYGVGEDSSAALPHAVVELCFTSSVRFLQPGLLLQVPLHLLLSEHVTCQQPLLTVVLSGVELRWGMQQMHLHLIHLRANARHEVQHAVQLAQ